MSPHPIIGFLTARWDEDEAVAREVSESLADPWSLWADLDHELLCIDPSRVLAEVAAKRAILAHLAAPAVIATADDIPWPGALRFRSDEPGKVYDDHDQDITASYRAWADQRTRIPAENFALIGHLAAVYADHPDYQQEWRP